MIDENLKTAIQASIQAGNEIIKFYNSDFKIDYKKDRSPVTEADKKANSIINQFLEPTGIPIISEENAQINFNIRKNWKKCWMVDPLDGTKEFINKNDEFTVNIALIEDNRPLLGVIYIPVEGVLYCADVKERKAWKAIIKDKFHLNYLKPLRPQKIKNSLRVVGSRSHMGEETENFIKNLKVANPEKKINFLSKGSSIKFCLLAEGNADIYPRFSPTMEWDTAAGHAICNATGIKVISLQTNKELSYNKPSLINNYFLVKN
ncbi:3'(2'),5'-bisphosphate nucleotidase CysQ [Abyssalbus ytuae]|uniref:3'(2'),5'-bisphosphate nucleotidase CysQ n=1 Tax=Abyssalbus ytuae TaxID=2926907 RepID=A0A9E6ZS00_9FLAO|nr:3'(2'),5'-bisphosphate nucleotidase CysQ [Abyssalbus ytuae]UOB19400.1 3'(2'),5'-bisphosphate nucleotidase CysQ [Abyssalbus ytuae]